MSQAYPAPERVEFKQHEQRLPWLVLLLDAYLIDASIDEPPIRGSVKG